MKAQDERLKRGEDVLHWLRLAIVECKALGKRLEEQGYGNTESASQ